MYFCMFWLANDRLTQFIANAVHQINHHVCKNRPPLTTMAIFINQILLGRCVQLTSASRIASCYCCILASSPWQCGRFMPTYIICCGLCPIMPGSFTCRSSGVTPRSSLFQCVFVTEAECQDCPITIKSRRLELKGIKNPENKAVIVSVAIVNPGCKCQSSHTVRNIERFPEQS